MAELPADVEEAVRTIEEYKATATPEKQTQLERARAVISNDIQNNVQRREREELAEEIKGKYPALAEAFLSGETSVDAEFPAVADAMRAVDELNDLERQRDNLEMRIEQLKATSEAALAGANAALEVRQRQAAERNNRRANEVPREERAGTLELDEEIQR